MRTDRMRFALVASAVVCLGVVSVVLSGQDQATDVANRIVGNMTKPGTATMASPTQLSFGLTPNS